MKSFFHKFVACVAAVAVLFSAGVYTGYQIKLKKAEVQVFFSPHGGCTTEAVSEIDQAKRNILVQAYSFTSEQIAKALIRAQERGVAVRIVVDHSQLTEKYSLISLCRSAGIQMYIDSKHAIAHNKIMVVDDYIIITGSFNFTKGAEEKNAENMLVIRNSGLAHQYADNWQRHLEHARAY